MVPKVALGLCLLLAIAVFNVEAQRDGRRRSGRRKTTTESPPPVEEPETEKSPQKLDGEAEAKPSSAQPTESETNAPPLEKESAGGNQGGPPFIVPRGTRKPRPQVRNSGESRPRPTLPSFSRKRGPKTERPDFKKTAESSVASSVSTSTTTPKPSRGSSRNRGSNTQDRNSNAEKPPQSNDETAQEESPKKRFGGGRGGNRNPSRGSRRHTTVGDES